MAVVWEAVAPNGGGYQNSGALADETVHGRRCVITGGDVAGFHRSEDVAGNGVWWLANSGASKPDHNNTQSVHFSSSISGLVFAMTGRGQGDLLRSTDLGKSWSIPAGATISGNGVTAGVTALRATGRMIADAGSYVWVAGYTGASTAAGSAIIRSTDRGVTFDAWAMAGREFRSIVVDPQDASILYGAQEGGTSPGLVRMSNCKSVSSAPTITKLTGADAAQGTTLTSARDVCAVVEGTKTWLYFITNPGGHYRLWKFNATDRSTLTDITGTLSSESLWTTVEAYRSGTSTTVWAGCWEPRLTAGKAEAVVVSRNGGLTWESNVTWTGQSVNLMSGQKWWHVAYLNTSRFDANQIRTEPGHRSVVYVYGRAGAWRSMDDGATWTPMMENLAVSMSHGTVVNAANPAQAVNCNTDWGAMATNNRFRDVLTQHNPAVSTSNPGENCFGGTYNSRGFVGAFGSRNSGDNDGKPQGGVYSSTTLVNGNDAVWVTQLWENAFGVTGDKVPRCLGVVDGLAANGDRILVAIAQGPSTGDGELEKGGIYRKVITKGAAANQGSWSKVGGETAFAGRGLGNAPEAQFYWPAGSKYIYALDRQTGLWRSNNYGAAGSWQRISTQTISTSWAGFLGGKNEATVFYSTATSVLRFDDAHTATAPARATTVNLPPTLVRPGSITWDDSRQGLLVTQRIGNTPVGLWLSTEADTTTTPRWTELSDDRYRSAVLYTQGMSVASDGTIYIDCRGNAVIIGQTTAAREAEADTSTTGSLPVGF